METYSTEGYTFTWNGGPYIDISTEDAEYPFDNINVWDYSTDRATISGRIAFISECEEWLNDEDDVDDGYEEPEENVDNYDGLDYYDKEYDCYV